MWVRVSEREREREKQSNLDQPWTDDFSLRVLRDPNTGPLGTRTTQKKAAAAKKGLQLKDTQHRLENDT